MCCSGRQSKDGYGPFSICRYICGGRKQGKKIGNEQTYLTTIAHQERRAVEIYETVRGRGYRQTIYTGKDTSICVCLETHPHLCRFVEKEWNPSLIASRYDSALISGIASDTPP